MEAVGITRLANVTGLDCVGIPVYMAVRPNSRSLSVSQGKGIDRDAAKASALMESIELWHAEHIQAPLRYDSPRALEREGSLLALEDYMLRDRALFRRDLPCNWIQGENLLDGKRVWVPFEMVNLNTVVPNGHFRTFGVSSNGLASGNHILEAIVHAVLELIERDSVTLFHQLTEAARAPRRVDETSIDDPACIAMLEKLKNADLDAAVWDTKNDIGVPVYCAAIVDRQDRPSWRAIGLNVGYGAHLSPRIALSRAITEAAQARLTVIAGSRDDNPPRTYVETTRTSAIDAMRREYFCGTPAAQFDAQSRGTDSFDGDIEWMLDRLRAIGITQVVAIPFTRPEFGLPVVRVIAPGLEQYHLAPGYRPGRRAAAVRQ